MPFPEPETALATTIVVAGKGEILRDKIRVLGRSQSGSTDFL
jgi:hypothetical protein